MQSADAPGMQTGFIAYAKRQDQRANRNYLSFFVHSDTPKVQITKQAIDC